MKILIMHPNFPGQYKHIARALAADPKNQVMFLTKSQQGDIAGVTRVIYKPARDVSPSIHRYVAGLEKGVLAAQAVWKACQELRNRGFVPDVVCAHPGWGDAMFIKDIFPDAPLLSFMEFYYHAFGADMFFDPKEPINPDDVARVRVKNAVNLLSLEACDWAISPTWWQYQQHPKEFLGKFSVLHDGIDTNMIQPRKRNILTLPSGAQFQQGDEIVTYVARNFEPYRGFPTVMRGINEILKRRPNCHVLVVGSDGVSYGKQTAGGKTYKEQMLEELSDLDVSRVHFLGALPYEHYLGVLQYSQAHIYYTLPFVLSWSMLEAMATGCVMVASDTAPVREVITHGENGYLVDFFSHEALADQVVKILENPDAAMPIREAARKTVVDRYALDTLLPMHLSLITDLANGHVPPPTAQKIKDFNPVYEHQIDLSAKARMVV